MSQVPQPPRPLGPGGTGYANGNSYYDREKPRYNQYDNAPGLNNSVGGNGGGAGGGRERMAGGYGGYLDGNGDAQSTPSQEYRPRSRGQELGPAGGNWRRRADRGDREWSDQNRSRNRSGGRDTPPTGGRRAGNRGTKPIEEVLQYIQQEWSFMADENCVPVQVALQLMDSSSLGRAHQYDQFRDTQKQLQKALKAIVNEHYQGFNSSLGAFHKIQISIQNSQNRVRQLKESLTNAKSNLSSTKPELKALAASSQGYDEMLLILSQIEQLQLVPEKLEARISEKRFLTAVDVLQEALETIRKPEMENIGALSDLRVYFSNQETSLTDILIEELHNHLYLKSPYCQERWKPYTQGQGKSTDGDDRDLPDLEQKPIHRFLKTLDSSTPMIEDASRNPEADNFYYIQLLAESLNKIGRLDAAVESIEHRLPVELFRVVDKTNSEVDQRHPSSMRGSTRRQNNKIDLGLGENNVKAIIVFDLLWTLYSKFEAIAEGHRVFHDVIASIMEREGIRNAESLTGGFNELWKLYQSEMRSLLHDYLATDGNVSYRSGQAPSGSGNIFRVQRDRSKRMFKLQDMDTKSVEVASEQDDLESILKASVPGLVSDSRRPFGGAGADSSQHHDGSATGHRLLVEPSVFNMGLLLPPSLSFLQRLKDIVPPGSDIVMNTLTSFLDDFLVNVFHPQLDETLVDLGLQTYAEVDAFQEDPQWPGIARKPIFKGTSTFFNLIAAFCKMLDTIPHDQAFSQLIITQMVTYFDRCCDWYRALVSRVQSKERGGTRMKTAAALAQPGEIRDTVATLWNSSKEDHDLLERETALLITNTNESPVTSADVVSDRKTITSLCLLYNSMKWLASKVRQLRHITDTQVDSSRREGGKSRQGQRWTLIDPSKPRDESTPVYLPMTQESVIAFDGVLDSYQQLAVTVLVALHLEIRCHTIQNIDNALGGAYVLEQPVNEPDPNVLTLNADLVGFDEDISTNLGEKEHKFITAGLGLLLDNLIVSNATDIKSMNSNGCDRMQLNILVLQQNLRNVESNALLSRSARFFDFFAAGPEAIVAKAKEMGGKDLGFTYDEMKALVELCYSEALASPRREVAMSAKRNMGEHLLQLSEHLWQT